MNRLDPNTLDKLAEIICDTDGPHHRQYWQLEKFFTNAGWSGVPAYDETGRARWTRELLEIRREDQSAIAQVIRRLSDPLEYPDDPEAAHAVADQLNRILSFEGLRLAYRSGRPDLVCCEPAFITPATSAPLSLRADLADIITDRALAELLRKRLDEARTCREYGAHLSSVIMLGSVLEGVLHDVAMQHQAEACSCRLAPKDSHGRPRPIHQWSLIHLVDVAHACGWIELDARRFSHELREYRNMVHPARELADMHHPDEDTVAICWNVVVAALNDLSRLHGEQ
jgi:hypothetical protein